jgi:cytochrome c-type biogenesis protein CcmH/NrfG
MCISLVVLKFSQRAQDYKGAADAFREALQLDPKNEDIKKALR